MASTEELTNALDAALVTARAEYRQAVIELAEREAGKASSPGREPADVDRIHYARTRVIAYARTRVIALDAAREELSRMVGEGAPLTNS
jgi:hypothetical protein